MEQKPHSQKDRQNEKTEGYVPDKLPEKEFRTMIVKMIQDLGKGMEAKIEKMQEMIKRVWGKDC